MIVGKGFRPLPLPLFLMKMLDQNAVVLMHGPAFDGSGELVERNVPEVDVPAYRQAGYERGPLPESVKMARRLAELEAERIAAEQAKPKGKAKAKAESE